jgi:hypothetical protein
MKQCLTLSVLLLICLQLSAQKIKELPDFGKVEKAELELTKCSFEEDAPAMVLFNEGVSIFKINNTSSNFSVFKQTKHHTRIKILNKKGFGYADIKIKYPTTDKLVSIIHLKAQTYNLDAAGNIVATKVEKNTIYDRKINKRYSEIVFAFPEVKEGSIIEYEYTLDNASEASWYFQQSIPVVISRFEADFPTELEVSMTPNVTLPLDTKENKKGTNNISCYTMENIPSLGNEPFMSCPEDYLQRMEIRLIAVDFPGMIRQSLVRTWPGIIKELMEDDDFGIELKKNIPRTAELDAMLKPLTDPYQKMLLIHKYVRSNMEWDNLYSIWALDGVKSAWKSKKGTSGEINLIMINLLKDADLDAHPVLVSTRENGIINTAVAGYAQFDKVLAYVKIGDKVYILDATDKITPSNMIPLEVHASEGLVIEKISTYEWGWKVLWDSKHLFANSVSISAAIDSKHQLGGDAFVTTDGYARLKLMPVVRQGDEALKASLAAQNEVKIENLEVINRDNDTLPLEQKFRFVMPASSTGDYHFFSLNLFTGLEKNPFIADERKSDIFFGYNQQYAVNCAVAIPEGYVIEDLPKNVKMITPDSSLIFTRMSYYKDGALTVRINLEFKSPLYSVDDYEGFREFYKKLFGMLNDKYVYKKKA